MSDSSRGYGRRPEGLAALVVVSLLVVMAYSGTVAAHTGDDGFHHHDGWMGTHGGTGGWLTGGLGLLWMLLWTLVLLAVPVALVYLLFVRRDVAGTAEDEALALLRRRYAGGEIDEEEFESRRARLLADRE